MADVICHAGPEDRPFEEQHSRTSIAVVLSGTFHYQCPSGSALMTPGSLFLGNAGECFRCGHEHATGDRCLSFSYTAEFFERVAHDAGRAPARFGVPRLPPIRALARLVAKGEEIAAREQQSELDEFAVELAARAVTIAHGLPACGSAADPGAIARVTGVVRMIDNEPDLSHELASLAKVARLSPYHFIRSFEQVTGTTPHQYVMRSRLRRAAHCLRTGRRKIIEIALDCGFNDVTNFNRTFRAEFGVTPRAYRLKV